MHDSHDAIRYYSYACHRPIDGPRHHRPLHPRQHQSARGNTLYLKAQASGTQNYVCLPNASGYGWGFLGPEATLFVTLRWISGDIRQQVMTHFLSPNPMEGGTPRPTWQGSVDTSAVWAKAAASTTDPNYVAPGAIPWLLLEIVGSRRGPTGGDLFTPTTFIQRLNTSGGVAPSAGCSQASNVGATALVPYATDYYFYKASRDR